MLYNCILEAKQKQLFKLYFKNKEINKSGIAIDKIMDAVKISHNNWKNFTSILKKYCLEKYVDFESVQILIYNNTNYLIIKFYSWTYLCIDLDSQKVVHFKDKLYPFNEEFFINNFGEEKCVDVNNFYYSIDFLEEGIDFLLEFINNNNNLLKTSSWFQYKIRQDDYMTYLTFNILGGNLTISFADLYDLDKINIEVDEKFNVSNSEMSFLKLKIMKNKIKKIKIPIEVIPHLLLDNIVIM